MMAALKHDPELPYAVYAKGTHEVNSRFKYRGEALNHRGTATWLEVVDTTPKPKIPEDAEFIYYYKSGYDFYVRQLENGDWKTDGGVLYAYSEILEVVEDAEVTVLVRKEEL